MEHIVKLSDSGLNAEFYFPYNFDEKEYVKNLLRARYVADEPKHWTLPVERLTYNDLVDYAVKYKVEIDPNLNAACLGHQTVKMPLQIVSLEQDADLSSLPLHDFKIDLYPFQKVGVKYAYQRGRVLNADDMGLGKTYQALGTVVALQAQENFIVVCPASVKVNWSREIEKAVKDCSVSIWDAKHRGFGNCVIINYENLEKQLPYLLQLGAHAIIFDEIHYLKSGKTKRTKSSLQLSKAVPIVLGLTGTPIINRPAELVSILQVLKCFDGFGNWHQFTSRYCQAHTKWIWVKSKTGGAPYQMPIRDVSGAANLEELHQKLRATCMIRRKKSEVLQDLPSKVRVQQIFEIDNREEYTEAQDNFLAYIKACAAEDEAFLATIKHLPKFEQEERIQLYQFEAGKKAERAEQLVMFETLKKIATRGKLDAVVLWIQDFLETGEKLVLFANHIFAQEYLLKRFKGAACIMGRDDAYERQAQIDMFRQNPACNLMVASLKAGGVGVDGLQEVCSNAAVLEFGWTPAEHLQAEDRVYRIGQNDHVTIYYLVAEHTIEETIQKMLAEKQAVCESVMDGAPEVAHGRIFNELVAVMKEQKATKGRLF